MHAGLAGMLVALCTLGSAFAPARAQYTYSPNNADEKTPGVRYFGSAKDERGALLAGVIVLVRTSLSNYTLLTDETGHFHVKVPFRLIPSGELVFTTCYKAGYELVRMTKRPGIPGQNPAEQIDCVLRRSAAG